MLHSKKRQERLRPKPPHQFLIESSSSLVLQKLAYIDSRFVALFFLHLVSGRCTTKPSWRSCWGTGCTWTPPTPSSSPPSSWSSCPALAGSLPWRRSSAFSSPTLFSSSSSPSSPWSAGFSPMSSESRSSPRLCTNHLNCSSLHSQRLRGQWKRRWWPRCETICPTSRRRLWQGEITIWGFNLNLTLSLESNYFCRAWDMTQSQLHCCGLMTEQVEEAWQVRNWRLLLLSSSIIHWVEKEAWCDVWWAGVEISMGWEKKAWCDVCNLARCGVRTQLWTQQWMNKWSFLSPAVLIWGRRATVLGASLR